MFLLLFAGHIYEKRNFCLLAEEFPFIFLTNWSVVEAMYFRLSIQVLFISKTFQYFHMSIPQASYNIAEKRKRELASEVEKQTRIDDSIHFDKATDLQYVPV